MQTYESGKQIGDYLLLLQLGRGRTSEVWTALRDPCDEPVGLKILLDNDAARAEREVCILRSIDEFYHYRDIDYRAGDAHFAFPLRLGRDVGTELRDRGLLAPTKALRIIGCAADYLARAHERGYVHGDLKPSHLIYEPDLTTRVVDWGDAREKRELDHSVSL
ncbi:phosphotransferase [Candidatus Woesearchaeota archaeon]|nr:phosphotransferase [Candidatus Woesearchaeota archaeon]